MTRTGRKWGLILGAAIAVWTLALHAMGFYTTRIAFGLVADVLATILPLAAVTLALLELRRRSGSLRVSQAILVGLIVGAVSGPISVGFLWLYHHQINPGWMDYLVEHTRAQGAARGVAAAEIETAVSNMRRSATDAAQITGGIVGSMFICMVIGLLGGAVLRRRPARP